MKDKRNKLTLLDTAEISGPNKNLTLRPILKEVWAQRINAQRYLFDREASGRVGEFMHSHVDLVVDNIEFARAPYPTCYFEIDALSMWRTWRPEQPTMPTADERVGYLIHQGTVLILTAGKKPNTVRDPRYPGDAIAGLSFRINRPQTIPMTKLTGKSEADAEMVKQAYVFGGQRQVDLADPRVVRNGSGLAIEAGSMEGELGKGIVMPTLNGAWTHSQIAAHYDLTPPFNELMDLPKVFTEICFLAGGDPLVLTTMLLLLNQPSKYVSFEQVPREVGMWKAQRKVFQAHNVVHLKLSRDVKVRDIFNLTDRAPPKAHKVSGHWKHYNKSANCSHHHPDLRQAWEPIGADRSLDGDYKRYWCPYCLQRRTWTEHYDTGGYGVSTHHYEVGR